MNRFVILDFDGVVVTPRCMALYPSPSLTRRWFDATGVEIVNRICARWDAHLVLSTSWRRRWGGDAFQAKQLLEMAGIEAPLYGALDGEDCGPVPKHMTPPDLTIDEALAVRERHGVELPKRDDVVRGDEVQVFLDTHASDAEYLILDDETDFWPQHMERLLQTHMYDGFRHDHIVELDRRFGISVYGV